MRTLSYFGAPYARQASRKDHHEKRPGVFEPTRPSFSIASYSPASEEEPQCSV
jgi:hypothetical protein